MVCCLIFHSINYFTQLSKCSAGLHLTGSAENLDHETILLQPNTIVPYLHTVAKVLKFTFSRLLSVQPSRFAFGAEKHVIVAAGVCYANTKGRALHAFDATRKTSGLACCTKLGFSHEVTATRSLERGTVKFANVLQYSSRASVPGLSQIALQPEAHRPAAEPLTHCCSCQRP